MHTLLFVYGTLKEGFANSHINEATRVRGEFETASRFPLFVIGEYYIPWLIDREDEGHHVRGHLFDADSHALTRMDELEMLGELGWFTRRRILVRQSLPSSTTVQEAFVYFGAAERLRNEFVHLGPISEFNSEHDIEYRKRAA
jgi:gamma-glutamylaminecyclotransferase